MKAKLSILFFCLCLIACDKHAVITMINNNSLDTISVIPWNDSDLGTINDSMIYNERIYMPNQIAPGTIEAITLPGRNFNNAPDSVKLNLYVIDIDSLNHYKRQQIHNIMKHALVKKITIQANKIKTDTFSVR